MIDSVYFQSTEHEKLYKDYLRRAEVHPGDNEREAMLYLISSKILCNKICLERFYDCKEHHIKDFEYGYMSSTQIKLIKLAYSLYNYNHEVLVMDTFSGLDEYNFEIAVNAIRIRFGHCKYHQS